MVSQDDGTSSCDRRAIECPKPGNVPIINGSFNVSAPPLLCGRRSGRNRFHCRTHQNGWATPNRFGPLLDGRDGRPSILAGTAASGLLLQAFYTVPEQYQQSLGDRCAHCRVLRTLPAFGHSIARRSLDEVPSS